MVTVTGGGFVAPEIGLPMKGRIHGGTRVGPQARREYLARMRERYETATRAAKSRLLDEVCEVTGYHRKAVIRLLRRPAGSRRPGSGRPVRYGPVVVESGVRILERVHFPYPVVPIVKHHHEAWDGAGYPNGVAGTRIPLSARILSVVDVFDALTSDRPYRRRHADAHALAMLHAGRGQQFQPEVVDQFIALVPALRRMDGEHAALTAGHRPPCTAPRVERGMPCTHQRPTTALREHAPRGGVEPRVRIPRDLAPLPWLGPLCRRSPSAGIDAKLLR